MKQEGYLGDWEMVRKIISVAVTIGNSFPAFIKESPSIKK
jgi:hypothetical protein